MGKMISIVVPCYNEKETVELFYDATVSVLKEIGYDYELIYVNDGSKDSTLDVLKKMVKEKDHMIVVDFSRNFGKEAAMYAGLKTAKGDYIAVMDVDLQDPPYMLKDMVYGLENEGYDIVGTRRVSRKGEPPIRSWFAKQFYKLINSFIDVEIVDGARDYRLMKRKVVESILSVSEYNRFSKGIFAWVGYKTKYLEYENVERVAGETSWSFWKLFAYSLDGIAAFSTMPLAISSFVGILLCIIAMIMIIFIIVKTLAFGDPVAGYPSLVCIIFMLSGVQLFTIGILSWYMSKLYLETKQRPIYIVDETNT